MLFSVLLLLGVCLVPAHSKATGEHLGSPLLQQCFEEAKKVVDDAYKYSREESLRRVRREVVRPHDALRLLKQPRGDTRSAVRSADYMAQTLSLLQARVHHRSRRSLNATDLLSEEDLRRLANITGCSARVAIPSCRTTPNLNKYRTATSVCNNLKNPRRGASNTPFARWLPAEYDDGISLPKGWNNRTINNFFLPLVRQVSNNILSTTDAGVVSDREFSHMVTLFGQWNDHDLTFTPFSPSIRSFSNGINCDESCERTEPCIPIAIPPNDPRLPTGPDSCIPAFRSAPVCGTGFSAYNFGGEPEKREQINALTAFLDLGQVYGSEEMLARDLRNLTSDDGLLRVNTEFRDNGRELLPFSPLQANMCATRKRVTNDTNAREVPCFLAGDVRVDENIALTSIHTLFMREHNRLARELKRINPHWDSETLYQEARKIMGAYTQVFVFRDYLPHIVGDAEMRRRLGRYPGYNPNVDPSISNVFATAAYRFAHLAIQPVLSRLDANYRENNRFPSVPLFKAFFTPWRIVFEGGIDSLLRGLVGRPAKLNTQDHMMVDALRERLFQFVMHLALDLGSLNMERGRDHGLPGYNAWRRFCGLSQPRNQAELARVLNNNNLARRLLQLYGTPNNIDVWLGGVAEPFVQGGRVGPLFACLIAQQFQKIRQGDRLWYENPGVFTRAQRAALSTASISRIICDNTGVTSVPTDAFGVISNRNRLVRCGNIRRLNLSAWRDTPCSGPGHSCKEVSGEETVNELDPQDFEDLQDNEGLLDNECKTTTEELQTMVDKLRDVADGLERVHQGATIGSLAGGVIGAMGGITSIVGLILAPFTLGASLIVTGVGVGVGAAGGFTAGASSITNMVNQSSDRKAVRSIFKKIEQKLISVVCWQQEIRYILEEIRGRCDAVGITGNEERELNKDDLLKFGCLRVGKGLGGITELVRLVQVMNMSKLAAQGARAIRVAEIATGVFSALFLAVDVFFIAMDAREIYHIRQAKAARGREGTPSESVSETDTIDSDLVELVTDRSEAQDQSPPIRSEIMRFAHSIRQAADELQKNLKELRSINVMFPSPEELKEPTDVESM